MPRFLLIVLIASLVATSARAELPPGSYDDLRAKAGEAVIIEVESVKQAAPGARIAVEVRARVMAVERSRAGLKPGESITIRYQVLPPGTIMPGPRPIPLLKRGAFYPAFLDRAGNGFEPAAHGESFVMSPEG